MKIPSYSYGRGGTTYPTPPRDGRKKRRKLSDAFGLEDQSSHASRQKRAGIWYLTRAERRSKVNP